MYLELFYIYWERKYTDPDDAFYCVTDIVMTLANFDLLDTGRYINVENRYNYMKLLDGSGKQDSDILVLYFFSSGNF